MSINVPYDHTELVTPDIIHAVFNDNRFAERVDEGEFRLEVDPAYDKVLSDEQCRIKSETSKFAFLPKTRTQRIFIRTMDGYIFCIAHRYLRPDGKLAASGLIDPKALVHYKILYWTHSIH